MKGKKYTTEDKIRVLREADSGKSILEVCREHNISEVSFHRWKRQFGQMEINEAKRLKELELENSELKKMLAESLLKNRVLEMVCEKSSEPGPPPGICKASSEASDMFKVGRVPDFAVGPLDLQLPGPRPQQRRDSDTQATVRTLAKTSSLWLSADRGATARGKLASRQAAHSTAAASGRATDAANQTQAGAARHINGTSDASHPPRTRVGQGLHR
jgi:putative transposase